MAEDDLAEKDGKRASVTDFLQVPRKKRKNYIIAFFAQGFDEELSTTITSFLRTSYPQHAVAQMESMTELRRHFSRNITILIIDDEVAELEAVLKIVHDLKVKRKAEKIPVLFLTRNPSDLIAAYHEKLLAFHEVDEYLPYQRLTPQEIIGRIKMGIDNNSKRKSRRFQVNLPVSFFHLNANKMEDGLITDLSVHGAKLRAGKDFLFREGDQIKLHVPVEGFLDHHEGDYLRVSSKVRRVMMSGNTVALSFEHLSDHQFLRLTQLVTGIVNQQMIVQQKLAKAKAAANAS